MFQPPSGSAVRRAKEYGRRHQALVQKGRLADPVPRFPSDCGPGPSQLEKAEKEKARPQPQLLEATGKMVEVLREELGDLLEPLFSEGEEFDEGDMLEPLYGEGDEREDGECGWGISECVLEIKGIWLGRSREPKSDGVVCNF